MVPSITKQKNGGRRQFGPIWSLVFVPLLLVAAGLSIPYTMCVHLLSARKERKFAGEMCKIGRTMPWPQFVSEMENGSGTLVLEFASMKGPVRWWWTPEKHFTQSSGLDPNESDTNAIAQQWAIKDASIKAQLAGSVGKALFVDGTSEEKQSILVSNKLPDRWFRAYVGSSWERFSLEFPDLR
jgi:hypothetical protein